MQKLMVLFTVMLLLSGFGAVDDARACTYDATGSWSFTPDSGQVILNMEVPVFGIEADIYQTGDLFSIQTRDVIYDGANLGSFGASGVVNDATYGFSPSIDMTADLDEMPGMQVKISLSSFELQSVNALDGYFDVYFGSEIAGWTNIADLTFTGEKNVVPVPAAIWLFGAGLIGLAGYRKKMGRG